MSNEDKYKDIWAEIMAEPRPHRLVPFPRNKPGTDQPYCEIAMVVLTAEESASITATAERKTRNMLKDVVPGKSEISKGYDELYRQFCAEGIIFRSCKNPENLSRAFFPSVDVILSALSVDEIAILLNHYYSVQIEMGPVIADLDENETKMWMQRMVEGGTQARFLLNSFSLEALKELISSMASQLKILQTDKSLPGVQQEGTT